MDKKSFRKVCLSKLHKEKKKKRFTSDKLVAKKVTKLLKKFHPRSILFYLPMKIEVDLRLVMNQYRKKCNIFVPFIVEESFVLVKYRLPLRRNRFRIYEPPQSHLRIKEIDMMIVPVVGVDSACRRVGFGKGMYDRFFQTLKKRPIVVFVQRKKCASKSVVSDDYDIDADFYITPKEILSRGKKYDNRDRNSPRRCRSWCRSGCI